MGVGFEARKRLRTYSRWRGRIQYCRLARAGFHYTGQGDQVKCESCGLVLAEWSADQDPVERHQHGSPECPFILQFQLDNGEYPEEPIPKVEKYGYLDAIGLQTDLLPETTQLINDEADDISNQLRQLDINRSLWTKDDHRSERRKRPTDNDHTESGQETEWYCLACKKQGTAILFLPCRHLVLCVNCAAEAERCVRCSSVIGGTLRCYFV